MPNDAWTHPDKEWRAVLKLARAYGWPTPEVTTNHRHWRVRCPGPQVPGVERPTCEFIAFSSAKDSERYAKRARRIVERCPHVSGSPLSEARRSLDEAHALLEKAGHHARRCLADDDRELASLLDSVETRLGACWDALSPQTGAHPGLTTGKQIRDQAKSKLASAAKQLRATNRSNFAYAAALRRREDLAAIAGDLGSVLASLGVPSDELWDT